ncbi:hypothetical protein QTP88_004148 [Uroleucon formosanum]
MASILVKGKIWDNALLNCYAPTEDKNNEVKSDFYEDLENTYDSLPGNTVKIIVGDLNAQIGWEASYRSTIRQENLHMTSNDNGVLVINFAVSKDLVVSSTFFPRKDIYKQTWVSPNVMTKSQIYHVIINKRHKSCISNVRSYRGADVDTDHYLVVTDFSEKLSVDWRRKQQQKRSKKQLNWNKAKDPKELQKYQARITKELNELNELRYSSTSEIELVWAKIKNTVTEAASTFQEENRNPKKYWFDKTCQNAIRNRNSCRLQMLQDASEERIQAYKDARILANRIIRRQKRLAEKKAIEDIESYKTNPRLFYKQCKSIKEGYKARNCTMSDDNGNLLLEPNLDEIEMIINSLKNNKSPEEDNINAELLKLAGSHLAIQIQKLIKSIWINEQIPKDWNTAIVCPVFKKGNTAKVENYRGISLLDTSYKVLSLAVLKRLEGYAVDIIGEYQCGFTRGKSTTDHIFTIRQIMEKYYEHDKDLYMIFVNFKQAYDSVNRQQLWTALRNFGIPERLVKMIGICNSNTYCKIRYQGELSPQFEVQSGLKQGDAMSPILFNLTLEKVVRDIPINYEIEPNYKNIMLAYADDIVILGDIKDDIMEVTEKLIESSHRMNLVINENKTKYLVMSRHMINTAAIKVGTFEQVDEFKYLGVNINSKNNMHNEIQLRIRNANKAYFAMSRMFSSRLLSKATKEKLYTFYLRPIVMYACETWSTTQGNEEKLLTFERKVLRKIYGPVRNQIGKYERRKNDELGRLYNKPNICLFLKAKRLEWAGHV